jgi:hypothetical protein
MFRCVPLITERLRFNTETQYSRARANGVARWRCFLSRIWSPNGNGGGEAKRQNVRYDNVSRNEIQLHFRVRRRSCMVMPHLKQAHVFRCRYISAVS